MKMTFQKLVIGTSMAIGMSALATAPAHATSFTFDNNTAEINTYTGGSNGTFIRGDAQGGTDAAITALTDNDPTSNVELWYSTENPTSNVGFTATQGNYSATVSSVTAADWSSFGSQWMGDLLNAYSDFKPVWNSFSDSTKSLITSSFGSLGIGNPNIGSFQFSQNGGVELTLVGDLDVKTKLSTTISTQLSLLGATGLASSLGTDLLKFQAALNLYKGQIGVSEIAKVVTGGKTSYAYSFNPTVSGITASDDKLSYSAYYTWNTPGYIASTPPSSSVPEPSLMLGLLGVAGVFATQRKFKKVSI